MKLIKQNDSAGGLIFKQNQNGKAMKQNYNFGKGFNKGADSNCYIECPFIPSIITSFSILAWHFFDPVTVNNIYSPTFLLRNQVNGATLSLITRNNGTINLSKAPVWNTAPGYGSLTALTGFDLKAELAMVRGINGNIHVKIASGQSVNINQSTLDQSPLENLYFAIGNQVGIQYQSRLIKDTKVFSRDISDTEYSYMYNLKLGNEPLNNQALEVWYKFTKAEILDFKGVQSVCVRDFSGNNYHGKIMNLPAGTLQEQLDYANNNLFFSSL